MGKYDDVPLGNQLAFNYPPFDVALQPKWRVPDVVVIEAAISGKHGTEGQRRHDENEFGRREPRLIEVARIEIVFDIGKDVFVFPWRSETKTP